MLDKPISALDPNATLTGADLLAIAQGNATHKLELSVLLTYIGANIASGAIVSFGTTLPQNNTGKNGDVFFFTTDGKIAQKTANTWTIVYTPSTNTGSNGLIYGTNTPPSNSVGTNDDTYINTVTGVFYKKSAGAWAQVYSIQTNSTVTTLPILFGTSAPENTLGSNSQSYINTSNRDFYTKENGTWVVKFTIPAGLNGNTILNGTTNPSNSYGSNGDFYVNTASNYFFGPKASGVWPVGLKLTGDTGPQGAQGPKGDTGEIPAKISFPITADLSIAWQTDLVPSTTKTYAATFGNDIFKTIVTGNDGSGNFTPYEANISYTKTGELINTLSVQNILYAGKLTFI